MISSSEASKFFKNPHPLTNCLAYLEEKDTVSLSSKNKSLNKVNPAFYQATKLLRSDKYQKFLKGIEGFFRPRINCNENRENCREKRMFFYDLQNKVRDQILDIIDENDKKKVEGVIKTENRYETFHKIVDIVKKHLPKYGNCSMEFINKKFKKDIFSLEKFIEIFGAMQEKVFKEKVVSDDLKSIITSTVIFCASAAVIPISIQESVHGAPIA